MPREKRYSPPPSVFGTTFTFLQTTSYYATEDIDACVGIPGADDAIIGQNTTSTASNYRVSAAGGTTWASADTGQGTAEGGVAVSNTAVYVAYAAGVNRYRRRILVADGSTSWTATPTGTSRYVLAVTSDDSHLFQTEWNSASPKLAKVNVATGAEISSITLTGKGPIDAACSDSLVVLLSDTEELIAYDIASFNGSSTPAWTLNLTTEPTLSFGSVFEGARVRHDGSGGFWLLAYNSTRVLIHVTSAGAIDIEIDVNSVTTLPVPTTATGLAVDKFGHVYVLVQDSGLSADVVRLDETGAFVSSSYDQGITLTEASSPTHKSIAVDDSGTVFIGDTSGDVTVLSQT